MVNHPVYGILLQRLKLRQCLDTTIKGKQHFQRNCNSITAQTLQIRIFLKFDVDSKEIDIPTPEDIVGETVEEPVSEEETVEAIEEPVQEDECLLRRW